MADPQTLAVKIEALLFSEGESISYKRLSSMLACDMVELSKAIAALETQLQGRGISILKSETEVALAVSPIAESDIRAIEAKDSGADIGSAGLEVLAILIYGGPATRADIDYIRGVNSSFTIRVLLSRALVERIKNPNDSREFLYRPTVELMAHLGIREGKGAPEYEAIAEELKAFEATKPAPDHDTHEQNG